MQPTLMERKSWSIALSFSILIPLNQQVICNGDFPFYCYWRKTYDTQWQWDAYGDTKETKWNRSIRLKREGSEINPWRLNTVSSNKGKQQKQHLVLYVLEELCTSRCPELVVITGMNSAVCFGTSPCKWWKSLGASVGVGGIHLALTQI